MFRFGFILEFLGVESIQVDLITDRMVWLRYGKYHRPDDKPAVIYFNGRQEWLIKGKLHRDNDLPAIIYPDGTKKWYQKGEFIRDDIVTISVKVNYYGETNEMF